MSRAGDRHGVSRRSVLAGTAGLATANIASARALAPVERPNILWLVSEDNNPLIGAYGDRLAHTPTIDALAAGGLLFRNVYSNAPVCAPSRFSILTGVYPESCAPAHHMRAQARIASLFRTYPELLRDAGYFCLNASKTDYNCDVDPDGIWGLQGPEAHWRHAPRGQPFMAVFNYETTHESGLFKPVSGRVKPDQVRVPAYLPDQPAVRQDIAAYYNLIETMDGELAARLAELKADGLADDTIVFYYSDNGGSLPRSKRYCYDEGHRCALVVHIPPKWQHLAPAPAGSEITAPVSFIDLAPTLLSIAGVPQPAQMRGKPFLGTRIAGPQPFAFGMRGRMDERIDFIRTVTDGRWRYIRNYMPHRPWGQHQAFAWLAKGYQAWESAWLAGDLDAVQSRFFGPKPYEELYDLEADRDQLRNRVDDPSAGAMLERLRRALDRHMLAINDNGFLPEGMAGEGFFESRDRRVYPLKRLMALASAAARRDPRKLGLFRAAASDPAPVVRYWAATGLLMLGKAAAETRGVLALLIGDADPRVAIVAAEALVMLGEIERPIAFLGEVVASDMPWQVRLQALNALTYVGKPARSVLPAIRAAGETRQEYLYSAGRYLATKLDGSYTPSTPIFSLRKLW